ncbi:hypothetical protein ACLQ2Q_15865 [Microbacterium sp. DT81.1]|uniref:hypothetical protein n=1 Tax=Microbacterium sp. DT81.1 TaxID=3393413 RepID=UPI003CEDDF15
MMATTWVLLPVPQEDYDELRHMVDFRQQQRGESSAPSAEELQGKQLAVNAALRAAFDEHKAWPASALARLAASTTATTLRFSQVMDLCSESPGSVFSTEEIAERTGMSVNEWRAACRKIGAHLRKHYPDAPHWDREPYIGEPMWPLVNISGRRLKVRDQLYVGVTQEQAKRWKSIR